MKTENDIPQETKFAQRKSPAAFGASPGPRIDEAVTLSPVTRASSVSMIDFFEACDRLPAGFGESSKEFEINRLGGRIAARQLPSIGRMDRLEESLYWFLSAATLSYLLFEIVTF
jgi:hypothetical protein